MINQSVFITGGAGFIGRAVAAHCLQDYSRVTVYDNLRVGKRENLQGLDARLEFVQGDICDTEALRDAMHRAKPQIVFHLAAHHFIPFCNAHPTETLRVNVEGTYAVFQAAAECGVKQVVVASSGILYPGREGALFETEPPVISDIYGLSKQMTEEICQLFAETTALQCIACRLFNTYGPYETNPHVIPHIMQCLHLGDSVPLGNLHPKRDYIYVDDVAEMLVKCLRSEAKHLVVNVGTGKEYSVADIIETLSDLLDRPILAVVDPDRVRPVDKPHQIAATTRLAQVVGELPKRSLREGLALLLAYEGLM